MEDKKRILRELSKSYGVDLSIIRRIAILNDYDINTIVNKLDDIADNKIISSPGLYTESWEDFQTNEGLW
jgi:hypothetical protein